MDNQLPPNNDNDIVSGNPTPSSVPPPQKSFRLGLLTIPLSPQVIVGVCVVAGLILSGLSYGYYATFVSKKVTPVVAGLQSLPKTSVNSSSSDGVATTASPTTSTSTTSSSTATTTPTTTSSNTSTTIKKDSTTKAAAGTTKTTTTSLSSGSSPSQSSSSSSGGSATGGSATGGGGSSTNQNPPSPPAAVEPIGPNGTWNLILDDEFTSDSSLNTTTWAPEWFYNGDVQNGTDMYSSNVNVSGGYLNLDALGAAGASGSIISSNPDDYVPGHTGFQFTYGFAEAKMYIPYSGSKVANWPAFWLTGQTWPETGEIDILEGLSGSACYHFIYGTADSGQNFHNPGGCPSGNYTGWHTFGVDWQPSGITYYYDGVQVGQITTGITSSPMYVIVENSTGSSGLSPVTTPSDVQVAYVRVWQ